MPDHPELWLPHGIGGSCDLGSFAGGLFNFVDIIWYTHTYVLVQLIMCHKLCNIIVIDKIPKLNDSSATSVRIDEDSEPIAHYSKKVKHSNFCINRNL